MVDVDPRTYQTIAVAALVALAVAPWTRRHGLAVAASLIALLAVRLQKRATRRDGE